ncbi:MAG: hypothetical protein ACPLTR_11585 [Thermacetogeniaceae bacterium]
MVGGEESGSGTGLAELSSGNGRRHGNFLAMLPAAAKRKDSPSGRGKKVGLQLLCWREEQRSGGDLPG